MLHATLFGSAILLPVAASPYLPTGDMTAMTTGITTCLTNSGLQAAYMGCASWSITQPTIQGATQAVMDGYCSSSCFPQIMAAYESYGTCVENVMRNISPLYASAMDQVDMSATMTAGAEYMCTKNFEGKYCVSQNLMMAQVQTAFFSPLDRATTFQDRYCAYISNLGCCFSSLIDMTTAGFTGLLADTTLSDTITTLCEWDALPPKCPSYDNAVPYAKSSFTLSGMTATLYNSLDSDGKIKIDAAISQDLADALGIDGARVSIVVDASGSDIKVTATFASETVTKSVEWKTAILAKLSAWNTWTKTQDAAPTPNALALESKDVIAETGEAKYAPPGPNPSLAGADKQEIANQVVAMATAAATALLM